ncbi:MAG: rod shape-determining protein RodA [candidate division KSB1 bacterium]|nr:rod shape-determining protein RodA [candidate division KSB1 bacterium]MDZ7334011.1 rod shape-determining protein RodA [candidate division KSB1 bacterium]MDZ7357446.1 rod shape-determining protein RodA [candidate division KSB1 bacterium]MDZ7399996.1 rod shape-determining protein RodA [candidate division KSB1 bacterium]
MMTKFEDIKVSNADYAFFLAVLLLCIIGLIAIYSASYQAESPALKDNFAKQLVWLMLGLILMGIIIILPVRFFWSLAYVLYFLTIFLLILTLVINRGNPVARWLPIGSFQFQPSELAKISVVIFLARYLAEEKRDLNKFKDILIAFVIVLVPALLIVNQPDLGTSLVFFAIVLPILFWAGLPSFYLFIILTPFITMISSFNFYTYFLAMALIIVVLLLFKRKILLSSLVIIANIVMGIITPMLWNQMREYQRHRILTFLGLEMDPKGLSYQVIQSKVAIGSGGFWGKGILKGTQTQLRFLPEQHTDFVFSVVGEELGFIGSSIVLILFLFLLLRAIYIAAKVRNKFSGLMVIGATAVLGFHIIINIGMTVGMMPVTGLPLPFLSYGGSFLLVSMSFVGIIINASIRRFRY